MFGFNRTAEFTAKQTAQNNENVKAKIQHYCTLQTSIKLLGACSADRSAIIELTAQIERGLLTCSPTLKTLWNAVKGDNN